MGEGAGSSLRVPSFPDWAGRIVTLYKGAGSRWLGRKLRANTVKDGDWSLFETLKLPSEWFSSWRCNAGVVTVGWMLALLFWRPLKGSAPALSGFFRAPMTLRRRPKTDKPLVEAGNKYYSSNITLWLACIHGVIFALTPSYFFAHLWWRHNHVNCRYRYCAHRG